MAAVWGEGALDEDARRAALIALLGEAPLGVAIFDRDLRFVVVNDLLAAVNGRPPADHVGRRIEDVLPNLRPDLVAGLRRAVETGEPVRGLEIESRTPAAPDLLRRFELSFHPLVQADGSIDGLMALVSEQTDQRRATEVLRASERRYRSLVEATTSLVWTVVPGQAPHTDWLAALHPDDQGRITVEWQAAVAESRTFEAEARVMAGGGIRHVIIRAVPIVEGGVVSEWIGASTDVTPARQAAEALRESEARLRLAVESGRMGMWDLDLTTGRIRWSTETAHIHGVRLEEFGGDWDSFAELAHPDDVAALEEQIARVALDLGAIEYEMRIQRDGGWNARVLSRGQVLPDEAGAPVRVIGMVVDVTDQWRQAQRVSQILESIGDAFFALDTTWRFTYVNPEAERVLRRSSDELLGRSIWEEYPQAVGSIFETSYRRTLECREVVTFDAAYGDLGWFDVRAYPSPDGISVYFRNIDALREAEHERQAAADRTTRLGHVAGALAEALREEDVTRVVLDNATAALGGRGGTIALFEPDGTTLRFVAATWPDDLTDDIMASDLSLDRPTSRAARQRQPVFLESPEEFRAEFPAVADMLTTFGDQAGASVPLLVRGQCLGAMSLTWAEPRSFPADDRQFIAALADTCAQALERARLYEREHRVAETLQLALLPERLADPDGITSAARYLPGTEGVAVGGDWYDLFDLGDRRLGVALGDVVGKGVAAAAVMGRLRNALRAYATATDGPAEVLAQVDDFAARFGNEDLATVVYGVLDTWTGELRYSSAGHLPPLLVTADGEATYLAQEPDLPVGVSAGGARHEHRVRLPAGATLVLYSDGLVEDRTRSIEDGMARLARIGSGAAADADVDATCARIVHELVGDTGGDDDVAVLVLTWAGPPTTDRCTVVLPPVVASARRARALLAEELARWGEEELVETGTLCVSEIVTNAVVHAGTPVRVDIVLQPDRVRVEVADGGAAPPERVDAADEDVHGRGIAIVELLSAGWGVEPLDDGKCVWFELRREHAATT
ncbi:MAG: protein phosphatase [Actinomycetia bacterium]|nr:protein phosphatase [Actinomycetes bacterium]